MKKNILIIPSLVLCSFIVSPLLGCEEPGKQNEYHPIQTTGEVDLTQYPFLENLLEVLPEPQASVKEEQPDIMQQSVMMPTEAKDLDLMTKIFDGLASKGICSYITNIKSYLQKGTYDATNIEYLDMLHAAIREAIKKDDLDSLTTILALCRSTDEYKAKIRINDDVAKTAYNFLISDANTVKYDLSVQLANKKIEESDQQYRLEYNQKTEAFTKALVQLITTHRQGMTNISDNFNISQAREIDRVQAPILNLGALSKPTRKDVEEFMTAHPVKTKENTIAQEIDSIDVRLNFLTSMGNLPKIENPAILQLTDK